MKYKKILIVGSLPFRLDAQSRAFDSYFHNWPHNKLRQIFSSPLRPLKGHCEQFYQITDYRMLKRHFKKQIEVGVIYDENDLLGQNTITNTLDSNQSKFYKVGKKKTPLKRLVRKWIWRQKYWDSSKLRDWIDEFSPDCVFLAWSDDFYTLQIAYSIAVTKNIPIISCIGDDYYFNSHFSINPFYFIYRTLYKKLFKKVITYKGSHVYIDDKIKDKYNEYFGITGVTVHVGNDDFLKSNFSYRNDSIHSFGYFGNLGYGRFKTLITTAKIMKKQDNNFTIHVFSGEMQKRIINKLKHTDGIVFHGKIPYSKIQEEANKVDAVLVVESLNNKRAIKDVKYSLSTKVADALTYGKPVVAIGHDECGAIGFIMKNKVGIVLNNKERIRSFQTIYSNTNLNELCSNVINCLKSSFDKNKNNEIFENEVNNLLSF